MSEQKYNEIKEMVMEMPTTYIERLENDIRGYLVKEPATVTSPSAVYHNNLYKFRNKKQEHFIVLLLDAKNEVIKTHVATIGLLNSSQVHPREIFVEAIKNHSASIIIAHNHPSGNNTPSTEDISVTKRICDAGKIIGINVLDHIIFSKDGFNSMSESGYLN